VTRRLRARTPIPNSPSSALNSYRTQLAGIGAHLWTMLVACCLLGASAGLVRAQATDPTKHSELVNQANAPISSLFQIRLQDAYAPAFQGQLHGQGNLFSIAVTMPLPEYRLLPLPQLSLLTIPVAATLPLPAGALTGLGDVRFLDIAVIDAGHSLLFGVGPTFVFPTASERSTGQGKWQAGPAVAVAFAPRKWLIGAIAQNPVSFAGDSTRPKANALDLQPFVTYQISHGWYLRSEPQMIFDWETNKQLLPLEIGLGRVFKLGPQYVNCFVEPAWNVSHDGPTPRYAITFGFSLLFPDFWGRRTKR
jgi:hypothetical protein